MGWDAPPARCGNLDTISNVLTYVCVYNIIFIVLQYNYAYDERDDFFSKALFCNI